MIGKLETVPALSATDLLAGPVALVTSALHDPDILVAPIDPTLADTASSARHTTSPGESANCVVVAGKRDGEGRFAACVILATTRADVNGVVRKPARRAQAELRADGRRGVADRHGVRRDHPLGLPAGWPVLVDSRVVAVPLVIIGSGLRRSKIVLPGAALARLATAEVIPDLAR